MALSNIELVNRGLGYLAEGLQDLVDPVMRSYYGREDWAEGLADEDSQRHGGPRRELSASDPQVQLRALTEKAVEFKDFLTRTEQGYAQELREARNEAAHNTSIPSDKALRWLDTMGLLLEASGAHDSAVSVRKLHETLRQRVFNEEIRSRTRSKAMSLDTPDSIPPWRELIVPHDDVARGNFAAAEFAANLHEVHSGYSSAPEYNDPREFFARTYLTQGLRDLLTNAVKRLNGDPNASPIFNLQTNFGGGKTHSLLALYHLFGTTPTRELSQEIQELVADAGGSDMAELNVKRVVLVGFALQPGTPALKPDGTEVRTIWGELAWQLGGREAFEYVADADRTGTSPGSALTDLLRNYGPAMILIDEWIAYARQLKGRDDLPAGTFDTQFTFAQALTEAVAAVPGSLLVVSIPASESGEIARGDIEAGGIGGREAVEQLQNVIRRKASQWRPSSKDESFEIVRRRIFKTPDGETQARINLVARQFSNFYRDHQRFFPTHAGQDYSEYGDRIKQSYPLHPELLDRLYEDWSGLERFQRTRGVLRLLSEIVADLWQEDARSPLINSGDVPLDSPKVNSDLTQYFDDEWKPIIDADIDGPDATARQIDREVSQLGQRALTSRIARAIFMATAPRLERPDKGIDMRQLMLGVAVPGDPLGSFGAAKEYLARKSTYFYEDDGLMWFDTHPSLAKIARDLTEQLVENRGALNEEIEKRLKKATAKRGVFSSIHVFPKSSADVPDTAELRLVVVSPDYPLSQREAHDSPTMQWIRDCVETKGAAQRDHRNMIVFVGCDNHSVEPLLRSVAEWQAWSQIVGNASDKNLSTSQITSAEERARSASLDIDRKIEDAYIWAIAPEAYDPRHPYQLEIRKIPTDGGRLLSERLASKLVNESQLVNALSLPVLGNTLRNGELTQLWQVKKEVTVGDLWSYFTKYPYMARLANRSVLDDCLRDGLAQPIDVNNEVALALKKDGDRYVDIKLPGHAPGHFEVSDSVVIFDAAKARQLVAEQNAARVEAEQEAATGGADLEYDNSGHDGIEPTPRPANTRFFTSFTLDADRLHGLIARIDTELLEALREAGSELEITLEISAINERGFSESTERTVGENGANLGAKSLDFGL